MRQLTRHLTFFGIVVCPLLCNPSAGQADEPALSPDEQKLQGAWKEISKKSQGLERDKIPGPDQFEYTFEKHRCVHQGPPFGPFPALPAREYTFVVDETTEPHRLDLLKKEDRGLDIFPGIYKWDGDRLVWCYSMRAELANNGKKVAKARPTKFEAPDKSLFQLSILERVKAPATSKKTEEKKSSEDRGSSKADESK